MSTRKRATDILHGLSRIPVLSSARLTQETETKFTVLACSKQRDYVKGDYKQFEKTFNLEVSEGSGVQLINATRAVPTNAKATVVSPSGKLRAVFVSEGEPPKEKLFVEIWGEQGLVHSLDLSDAPHGKPITNAAFGNIRWSPDEAKLAYAAEPKPVPGASFFKPNAYREDGSINEGSSRGVEFCHEGSFGETMPLVKSPKIFVLYLNQHALQVPMGNVKSFIKRVEVTNDDACGQVEWHPNSNGLVFVRYETSPLRLGLIFCQNRKSTLTYARIPADTSVEEQLRGEIVSCAHTCKSPRFSPDGSKLAVLTVPGPSLPHMMPCHLTLLEWDNANADSNTGDARALSVNTLLAVPEAVESNTDFPGICADALPERCWSSDSRALFVNTNWSSVSTVVRVEVDGVFERVSPVSLASWELLDLCHNVALFQVSEPNRSPSLLASLVRPATSHCILESNHPLEFSYHILEVSPTTNMPGATEAAKAGVVDDRENSPEVFHSILLLPGSCTQPPPPTAAAQQGEQVDSEIAKKVPLILFPHGGPHSSLTTSYMMVPAFLVRCGYAVLMPNYRGSLGYSSSVLHSLLGKVGRQDVDDMMDALTQLGSHSLAQHIDLERVVLFGGSHGGFLVHHLIGQFPKRFKACCSRNPVCNIAAMVSTSDIPDWCAAEALNSEYGTLTSEMIQRMFDCSPIAHVSQVETPVLMCLGQDDLRVPTGQALDYCNHLKRLGKAPVKVLMYPGNGHALAGVPCEADHLINTALFFDENL